MDGSKYKNNNKNVNHIFKSQFFAITSIIINIAKFLKAFGPNT